MLIVTVYEGEYVMIGDNIRVHFDHKNGRDSLALGIEAPKDVQVLRGKLYEDEVARNAANGDEDAKILSAKLQAEHNERRRVSLARRTRLKERRTAAGR